ncbi:MAG: hypothetical protein AAGF84_10820 [Planctomycetota bacterium]
MKLAKKRIVGWRLESTKGTAETLTAADIGEYAFEPTLDPDVDFEDRMPSAFAGGTLPRLAGMHAGGCRIGFELKGSGVDATTAPKWADLFEVCALAKTVNAGDVTYAQSSDLSAQKTATINFWDGTDRHTLVGAAGTYTIEPAGPGRRIMIVFELRGTWIAPIVQATPTGMTYNATAPHQFKGVTLNYGGSGFCHLSRLRFDPGNETQLRPCVNQASGIEHGYVLVGVPTIGMDPEDAGVAADDVYGEMLTATTGAFSLVTGTAGGNRITLALPRLQRHNPRRGERDGLVTHEIEAIGASAVGDDAYTIKFD